MPKRSKRKSRKAAPEELTAADHAKVHAFKKLAETAEEHRLKQEARASRQELAALPQRARKALEGVIDMIRRATKPKKKRSPKRRPKSG